VVVVGVLTWAAYATFRASYVLFSVFVTGLVVFLLSVVTPTPLGTAVDRLVDTIIGGALALILYAVWPTWAEADARQAMAELTDVLGRFLRTVLAGYTGASGPSDADAVEIRRLVRSLRRARSNAEAAVARSVSEPAAHRMDPHQAGDALSALRRMSLCGYALAVALPAPDQPRVSLPGLDVLRDELSEALGQIRASALHPGPVADPPPLRRVHSEIEGSVEARPGSAERWLLDVTDELVDAVDTAGFSLGTWRPFPARTASLE
jgi:uncharacterized membrane protein YccC